MAESITKRLNKLSDKNEAKELRELLDAARIDIAAINTQLAQLITDYNANATIATDTTAVAPTLTFTA